MKMMRRTRTTSTSGVTFMSGRTSARPRARRRLGDALTAHSGRPRLAPPLDGIGELPRRGGERPLVARDRAREVVEGEHRRDRDREPERGLDQGFADAGGDGRQTPRARGGDT